MSSILKMFFFGGGRNAPPAATVPAKNPNAPHNLTIEEAKTAMLTSKEAIFKPRGEQPQIDRPDGGGLSIY